MKTARIATIAALLTAMAAPAFAEGDAAKGKKIFNKCKACHAVGEGAKNKLGPVLTGIVDSRTQISNTLLL
jgi:cytochrome c